MSSPPKPALGAVAKDTQAALDTRSVIFAACLLLAIAIWFANISYRTLTEPDEGRYAEIPREMLATGDWVTPHLNAIPYLEKPPLQYWATAIAYSVFGVSPWVSRLWSTTLGLLGIAVTYGLGRALWGARAGQLAALILASCPLYFIVGHLNTLDIALAFFLNAAIACLLLAQRQAVGSIASRRWMDLCWALLGLGFLQKGLVAFLLPAIALTAYSLCYRDRTPWRRLYLADGLAILALITLPWLIMVESRNPGFLHFFFIHEHFARYASTVHKRAEPWWYFIAIMSVGVLPWIAVMVRAAATQWRAVVRPGTVHAEGLLLIWAATVIVFFSLSGSKLATYVVPAVAPLALVAGRWMQLSGPRSLLRTSLVIMMGLSLLWLCLEPLVGHFVAPGIKQVVYLEISTWAMWSGIIGLTGAALAWLALRLELQREATMLASGSFCIALALLMCGTNAMEKSRGGAGLASVIQPQLRDDATFYCVNMYWQTLPFSLQRPCVLVKYHGELELQFASDASAFIPSIEQFATRWRNDTHAVAVVNPADWAELLALKLPMHVLVQQDNIVVIRKP